MKEWLKKLFIKFIEARQAEANRRIAMMHLSAMTDRELNDIGIGRGDIRRVIYDESTQAKTKKEKAEHSKLGWKLHKTRTA